MDDLLSYSQSLSRNLQQHSQEVLSKDLTEEKIRQKALAYVEPIGQEFIRRGLTGVGQRVAKKLGIQDLKKETLEKFIKGKIEERLPEPLKQVKRALAPAQEPQGERLSSLDGRQQVKFSDLKRDVSNKLKEMGQDDLADQYNPETDTPINKEAYQKVLDTLRSGDEDANEMADDLEEARSQYTQIQQQKLTEQNLQQGDNVEDTRVKTSSNTTPEETGETTLEATTEETLGETAGEEAGASFLDFIPGLDLIGLALGIGGLVGGIEGSSNDKPIQQINTASQFGVN